MSNLQKIVEAVAALEAAQGEHADVLAAMSVLENLQGQDRALQRDIDTGERNVEKLEAAAEAALTERRSFDQAALTRAHEDLRALRARKELMGRGIARNREKLQVLEKQRAARFASALRPVMQEVVAAAAEAMQPVLALNELMGRLHIVAQNRLPSVSDYAGLQAGHGGFLTPTKFQWWRDRVVRAGLLPANKFPAPEQPSDSHRTARAGDVAVA